MLLHLDCKFALVEEIDVKFGSPLDNKAFGISANKCFTLVFQIVFARKDSIIFRSQCAGAERNGLFVSFASFISFVIDIAKGLGLVFFTTHRKVLVATGIGEFFIQYRRTINATGSAQGGSINFVTVDGQYQFIAFTFDVGDFGVCAKRSSFRQFIAT